MHKFISCPVNSKIILFSSKWVGPRGSVVWLRDYATSLKVAGSSPDEVDFFFFFSSWPNPSSRTMVLVSTQSLTKMSTRNFPGG
jgi:hypothetical protein